MDIFKLRKGEHGSTALSEVAFHIATSKKYPWYQEHDGKIKHYAVCPECENPLNIVNLDVDHRVDTEGRALSLYAKHAMRSIPDLADYDVDAYEDCSLRNPTSFNGIANKRKPGKTASEILHMLAAHADAVHLIIERFLKLKITDELFRSLLTAFKKQDGQLYRSVSTSNLPYALLYMGGNVSTYGCKVKEGSPFVDALQNSEYFKLHGEKISYSSKEKISPNPRLRFFFTDHVIRKKETGFDQTMILVIEEERGSNKRQLYKEALSLDISFYRNVVDKRARLQQIAQFSLA